MYIMNEETKSDRLTDFSNILQAQRKYRHKNENQDLPTSKS